MLLNSFLFIVICQYTTTLPYADSTLNRSIVSFNQSRNGCIYFNDQLIDHLNFFVNRLIVISISEYFYVVDGSLFHKVLFPDDLASIQFITDSVDCTTFDSLTSQLWWASIRKGILCNQTSCEPLPRNVSSCEKLDVTEATYLIISKSGEAFVINRNHSTNEVTTNLSEDSLEVPWNNLRISLLAVLSLLLLGLLISNGGVTLPVPARHRGTARRGRLVQNERELLPTIA